MLLGCIGDDFTGSSDLANTLAKQGMRTVQYSGIPQADADPSVEAGVVSLKSRSIPAAEAARLSLEALNWLQTQGCKQFFFKYCSTFDSTPEGNIGPVADALAEALGADRVIVCPAFPGTGRSVYQGHLFVKDRLLNESGLQNHPLNPMTDPDLRRWLARQSQSAVGHVPIAAVLAGDRAVKEALAAENKKGNRLIVVDALQDKDLMTIGRAAADLPLVTGGSGVALGLPSNFKQRGQIAGIIGTWKGETNRCVALSGSCSEATRAQVRVHAESNPTLEILTADVISGVTTAAKVCKWLLSQPGIPLAYSSADPETVDAVQKAFGREAASSALESFFAEVARQLVNSGLRRLIVAGGETSGAVVEGLGILSMEIGPEIDPGVPAMRAGENLVIALKSGNFGAPGFFAKAAGVLERASA
jgi:uncharacterized protein YgbK (DUF1537 family)